MSILNLLLTHSCPNKNPIYYRRIEITGNNKLIKEDVNGSLEKSEHRNNVLTYKDDQIVELYDFVIIQAHCEETRCIVQVEAKSQQGVDKLKYTFYFRLPKESIEECRFHLFEYLLGSNSFLKIYSLNVPGNNEGFDYKDLKSREENINLESKNIIPIKSNSILWGNEISLSRNPKGNYKIKPLETFIYQLESFTIFDYLIKEGNGNGNEQITVYSVWLKSENEKGEFRKAYKALDCDITINGMKAVNFDVNTNEVTLRNNIEFKYLMPSNKHFYLIDQENKLNEHPIITNNNKDSLRICLDLVKFMYSVSEVLNIDNGKPFTYWGIISKEEETISYQDLVKNYSNNQYLGNYLENPVKDLKIEIGEIKEISDNQISFNNKWYDFMTHLYHDKI
jgi:hypothetical protein